MSIVYTIVRFQFTRALYKKVSPKAPPSRVRSVQSETYAAKATSNQNSPNDNLLFLYNITFHH